jgi:hypothetical protein
MEEKKIILFALDSMTVKLDFDNGSGKKKK